ncbi:MAG: NosD domain-containing protein [Candidatus Jordarchaeaceae archaeon]
MKRIASIIMLILLSVNMLTFMFNIRHIKVFNIPQVKAEPATIIVPENYSTIQEAINAANVGDTIFVKTGTYYENVVINKTISLIGEKTDSTIIDGSGAEVAVQLRNAENIAISNFTIKGGILGMDFQNVRYVTMRNISLTNNKYNIRLRGNLLEHFVHDIDASNTVNGKPIYYWINQHDIEVPVNAGCVFIINSINITVRNLNLANNWYGVWFLNTNNSVIENVNCSNSSSAICLESSHNNKLRHNMITNNSEGIILLYGSKDNRVENNTLTNNENGICLGSASSYNEICGNAVANNTNSGVFVEYSTKNLIVKNTITNNQYGIYMNNAFNNTIYHNNFINNTYQAYIYDHIPNENFWDNGYPSGGNYWSNYPGVDLYGGPFQNETGSDGISDEPHVIGENNIDKYPLVGAFYDFEVKWTDDIIYHVEVISNSTVSNFLVAVLLDHFPPHLPVGTTFIEFFAESLVNTKTFCRVTIPRVIINGSYVVLVGSEEVPPSSYLEVPAYELPYSNNTHAYIYFSYNQTEQKNEIIIVPEYSSITFLLMVITAPLVSAIFLNVKKKKRNSSFL